MNLIGLRASMAWPLLLGALSGCVSDHGRGSLGDAGDTPSDRPPDTCAADCGTQCGDGRCDSAAGENCANCSADCGTCPPVCGDGRCDSTAGENCANCTADCGTCPPVCGDGLCDSTAGETCTTCPTDCGACPTGCGNAYCNAFDGGETCSNCPVDCRCGTNTCQQVATCLMGCAAGATCPLACYQMGCPLAQDQAQPIIQCANMFCASPCTSGFSSSACQSCVYSMCSSQFAGCLSSC